MDNFADYIDTLSARYGRSKVFNDFLTIAVCCLSMGKQEDLYFKTIKAYTHEELTTFQEAFAALVIEMDNNGAGLKDVLGEYFEKYFYNERLGQFFTPPSLCKLMTELSQTEGENIYDPCCGSGRIFLAAAEKNREVTFYGSDISETCCKMTLINMCLNGLKCRITWMNSLSLEIFKEWAVTFTIFPRIPFIVEIKKEIQTEKITSVEEVQPFEPINKKQFKFRRFIA